LLTALRYELPVSAPTNEIKVDDFSYIDLLNPKYVVLENVGGIVNWQVRRERRTGDNPAAPGIGLIVRCLTAMG